MLPRHLTHVFPDTTDTNPAGHLTIGGCDAVELAEEFGTPLYILDDWTKQPCVDLRQQTPTLFA